MDSDSEGEEDGGSQGGSPSPKQQAAAEEERPQQAGLPAVGADQVAANLAAPGGSPKGTKRAREKGGELGECGAHPGPCNEACQDLEADEQLRRQKQAQVGAPRWHLPLHPRRWPRKGAAAAAASVHCSPAAPLLLCACRPARARAPRPPCLRRRRPLRLWRRRSGSPSGGARSFMI